MHRKVSTITNQYVALMVKSPFWLNHLIRKEIYIATYKDKESMRYDIYNKYGNDCVDMSNLGSDTGKIYIYRSGNKPIAYITYKKVPLKGFNGLY